MKIIDQQLKWDYKENKGYIYSKFEDGSIGIIDESLNSEQAAQWEAEHKF